MGGSFGSRSSSTLDSSGKSHLVKEGGTSGNLAEPADGQIAVEVAGADGRRQEEQRGGEERRDGVGEARGSDQHELCRDRNMQQRAVEP